MTLKKGVSIRGARPELVLGLMIADSLYILHSAELVVTEITGGVHKDGSLHYTGQAADLRTWDINKQIMASDLEDALGAEWDVVIHDDHIHIEWQPKGQIK